jgi:hypothetical protein
VDYLFVSTGRRLSSPSADETANNLADASHSRAVGNDIKGVPTNRHRPSPVHGSLRDSIFAASSFGCRRRVRDERGLFARRLLQDRNHAVDDIVDRCPGRKLDFFREVRLPVPFRVFSKTMYSVNSMVFENAPS